MHHAFSPTSLNPSTNEVRSFYAGFLKILTISSVLSGYTVTSVHEVCRRYRSAHLMALSKSARINRTM